MAAEFSQRSAINLPINLGSPAGVMNERWPRVGQSHQAGWIEFLLCGWTGLIRLGYFQGWFLFSTLTDSNLNSLVFMFPAHKYNLCPKTSATGLRLASICLSRAVIPPRILKQLIFRGLPQFTLRSMVESDVGIHTSFVLSQAPSGPPQGVWKSCSVL